MAKGKLSGMQSSGMQRASKRKQEEDQERKKQQARQEQQSSADRYSKANRSATSDRKGGTGTGTSGTGTLKPWQKRTPMRYQKPGRSTADTEREIAGPEKLPNYIDAGQEPGKPEKLPYRPAESKAGVRPLGYSPFAGTAAGSTDSRRDIIACSAQIQIAVDGDVPAVFDGNGAAAVDIVIDAVCASQIKSTPGIVDNDGR